MVKHQAVTWAVHWLHAELEAFYIEHEHVVLIVLVVTGALPQVHIVDIGRNNFLETAYMVLLPDPLG